MAKAALTFIGKDRAGIIAEVTKILAAGGANIEDATMTLLEDQFAMILIAKISGTISRKRIEKCFGRLKKKWGLQYFWKELPDVTNRGEKHPAGSETYILSILGKDRTGIVYETSKLLAQQGINITDLNSRILGKGRKSVFAMILEADIPAGRNISRIKTSLGRLKRKLGVDVTFKRLERLAL